MLHLSKAVQFKNVPGVLKMETFLRIGSLIYINDRVKGLVYNADNSLPINRVHSGRDFVRD